MRELPSCFCIGASLFVLSVRCVTQVQSETLSSLPPFVSQATVEHESEGVEYLVEAAEKGVKAAMLEVARAYDTGLGLGTAHNDDANHSFTQR